MMSWKAYFCKIDEIFMNLGVWVFQVAVEMKAAL